MPLSAEVWLFVLATGQIELYAGSYFYAESAMTRLFIESAKMTWVDPWHDPRTAVAA